MVELLLATFLVGVVTALSALTFNAVTRGWQVSADYMDKMQRTDYALDQVISGLRSMYYPHDGKVDERYGFQLTDNGDGDSPRSAAHGDSPRGERPPTGFALPDGEMVRRLAALYGARRADAFRRRWEELRSKGQDAVAEAEKERFCRRMYSLSPFVKTFKERIAFRVNRRLGRSGHVFEGRFFSGLVDEASARRMVSLYIDCNPVRAGLAKDPSGYAWCGYAAARDARSAYCERCRRGYEATFGMGWADADRAMRAAFRTKLPANARERLERGEIALSPSQIVHLRVPELSFGAYVSRHADFARRALGRLARGFPAASARSLARLVAMVDWDAA